MGAFSGAPRDTTGQLNPVGLGALRSMTREVVDAMQKSDGPHLILVSPLNLMRTELRDIFLWSIV